jgi:hypothetical protein
LITANVFSRVLLVAFGDLLGSAFTIEVDGRQYLVTARHVATAGGGTGPLRVVRTGDFEVVPVVDVAVASSDHVDVAVVAPAQQLTRTLPFPASMDGLTWGQEMFFLGFPFGLQGEPREINEGRPLPFVKRAQHSGEFLEDGGRVMVLDGHNVKGMSGGPIVFRTPDDPQFRVAGIVQSYWRRQSPVFQPDGSETNQYVIENPGILLGYSISYAVDLAARLGTGFPVVSVTSA